MTYTLWSRGRLLGESELDYVRVFQRHRTGDFYPTDVGARVMPIATGVSAAGINLARLVAGTSQGARGCSLEEKVRQTSEWADLAAAQNHSDALALELRGPDDSVIPTNWIDIRDTEFLLFLARDDSLDITEADHLSWDDVEEEYEDDLDVEYGSKEAVPRYQLQVMLLDDAAVP